MKIVAAMVVFLVASLCVPRAEALTFTAGDSYAVGSGPQALAVADLNHDGTPDIVTANNGSNDATVLLGPSFTGATVGAVKSPTSVAVADVNGDSNADLVTIGSATGDIGFRYGNGSGTFASSGKYQTASQALVALATGDLNADGRTDIVTDSPSGGVRVLLGTGGGAFSPPSGSPYATGSFPTTLQVADMNNDPWPDVVAASATAGTVSVLFGNGGGALTLGAKRTLGGAPSGLAIGDVNGDGRPDVAVVQRDASQVAVLIGDGLGNLNDAATIPSTAPRGVALGDVNADGETDVLAVSDTSNDVTVALGDGNGSFLLSSGSPFAVGGAPRAVASMAGDIVVARSATNDVLVRRNASTHTVVATPQNVDFGGVGVGDASPAQRVMVAGDGLATTIASVRPTSGEFTVTNDGCTGRTVGDGYPSCAVDVRFAPQATGSRTATLRIDAAEVALGGRGLDTDPPDTTITAAPTALTNDPDPDFAFTSDEDGSTFACSLDGGAYAPCASPYSTPTLPDGAHTFAVRATDAAGNIDPTPASSSFTVDTQAPETTITSAPEDPTNDTRPAFTFTSDDGDASFGCTLDGAAYGTCTSPFRTAQLADGTHTFGVRSTDRAGNTDPTPATHSFMVDTHAPETTITDGPADRTTDRSAAFAFAADEATSFTCSFDGSAFASCISPFVTAPLADGTHTFAVRATDAAGNTDATPATRSFTVYTPDTQAPETTITEHPSALTNDTTPTFRFISDESGATFTCAIDGADPAPCGSPYTAPSLHEGHHTFDVAAVDGAGNVDPTPDGFAFTVDVTKPNTTISGPSRATREKARFVFRFSEDVQTVWCSVDGSGYSECRTPYNGRALHRGKHVLRVKALDAAGNLEDTPAVKTFTIVRGR